MKKIILLTLAILMISNVANACGGITLKGKSGATYCLSKHKLHWYSAYAWCKDQGMELIDVKEVCGQLSGKCSELALTDEEKNNISTYTGGKATEFWTRTAASSSAAYYISIKDANIGSYGFMPVWVAPNALCK
ncbi:MAG: hypothetical protein IKV03_03050 [Alphaproteobacteria bacterium]|nr:hypothetical protein [Alphaproteobacteria bacterium]